MISDGAVLAALPECESLVCANLLTGDFLWDRIERGNWNYIAGVYNKRFYLVGDKSVMAFDLRTSGKAWSQPATLPNGQRVAGRTVFGEDSLLLPSTNSQIYSISTEDGRILDSVKVDYPAGNLTVAAGSLFSQGISEVGAAYLGGEALENSIRSRLELNPKDVWALTRRSESLLESGKYRDAIESLRLAREQQPRDEEIRVLLVEALLKLVRAEPDAVPEFTKELEQLADLAEERIELLRVLAEGAIRQQQWQVAIDRLVALSKLASIGANRPSLARGERIELGDRDVSLDDWIGARVAELVRGRSADELVKLQKPVEQFIGSLGTLPNPLRERLLRQFGQLAAGDEMRLALVRQWIEDREFLKAERALLEAVDSVGDSDGRRPWHLMLARLYAEAGWVEDAEYHLSQGEAGGKAASDEELGGWERALLMDRIQADEHGYFWQPWPQYVKVTQASQELSSQSLEPKFLNASGRRARHWRAWTVAETTTSEIRLITPGGQTEVTVNLPRVGANRWRQLSVCLMEGCC